MSDYKIQDVPSDFNEISTESQNEQVFKIEPNEACFEGLEVKEEFDEYSAYYFDDENNCIGAELEVETNEDVMDSISYIIAKENEESSSQNINDEDDDNGYKELTPLRNVAPNGYSYPSGGYNNQNVSPQSSDGSLNYSPLPKRHSSPSHGKLSYTDKGYDKNYEDKSCYRKSGARTTPRKSLSQLIQIAEDRLRAEKLDSLVGTDYFEIGHNKPEKRHDDREKKTMKPKKVIISIQELFAEKPAETSKASKSISQRHSKNRSTPEKYSFSKYSEGKKNGRRKNYEEVEVKEEEEDRESSDDASMTKPQKSTFGGKYVKSKNGDKMKGDMGDYWFKKEFDPTEIYKADKYICRICNFTCKLKCEIIGHCRANHKVLKNPTLEICNVCTEVFSGKVALKQHMKIEHGQLLEVKDKKVKEKRFKCNACNYESVHESSLKVHYRDVHLALKPYVCEYCPFAAAYKASVQDHINSIHKKLRPFKCKFCNETFTRKYVMNQHVRGLHLNEKPHKCIECNFRTLNRYKLNLHIRAQHLNEKPYSYKNVCPHCKFCTRTKIKLLEHLQKVHPFAN